MWSANANYLQRHFTFSFTTSENWLVPKQHSVWHLPPSSQSQFPLLSKLSLVKGTFLYVLQLPRLATDVLHGQTKEKNYFYRRYKLFIIVILEFLDSTYFIILC